MHVDAEAKASRTILALIGGMFDGLTPLRRLQDELASFSEYGGGLSQPFHTAYHQYFRYFPPFQYAIIGCMLHAPCRSKLVSLKPTLKIRGGLYVFPSRRIDQVPWQLHHGFFIKLEL